MLGRVHRGEQAFHLGGAQVGADRGRDARDGCLGHGGRDARRRRGGCGERRHEPVRLARAVLAESREVLLVGEAAAALAASHGLPRCPPEALVTDEARRRWQERRPATGETVGAVARDGAGHVAAATSTGGVTGKRSGRVGDSAVIGAGTYADDRLGAGSATGPGEAIIRVCLVRSALELVGRGLDPAWAAQHALAELERRLGAAVGLILLDAAGRVGIAYTTEAMAAAWRSEETGRTLLVG